MATGLFITVMIIRVVARQLDRRHDARVAGTGGGHSDQLRQDVQELRTHVEALEERLDFTERLLTQERAKRSLEGGK